LAQELDFLYTHMSATVAFGKIKYDVKLTGLVTIKDLKHELHSLSSVPPEHQRLLVKGKERKADDEALADAGVKDGGKIMLLTTPGYVVPPANTVEKSNGGAPAPAHGEADTANGEGQHEAKKRKQTLESTMEEPAAAEGTTEAASSTQVAMIRQGWTTYKVTYPSSGTTIGALKDHLATLVGIQAKQMRLLTAGKEQPNETLLSELGKNPLPAMLFFKELYHRVQEAQEWLTSSEAELGDIEQRVRSTVNQARHRLGDAFEVSLLCQQATDFLQTCYVSLEALPTNKEWDPFRDRLKKVEEMVEELTHMKL